MHFDYKRDRSVFFIESLIKYILEDISNKQSFINDVSGKIGIGDQIAVTVWGLQVFPLANINPDQI